MSGGHWQLRGGAWSFGDANEKNTDGDKARDLRTHVDTPALRSPLSKWSRWAAFR
jgi:hypothetical protein